jgi:N-methylhydantoinase B/oxoprolinase/acetone carboxylase alpha subunit
MAEDEDNIALHLLRDIRADVRGVHDDTGDLRTRMVRMGSRFEELQEATVAAVGWAGFAKSASDCQGEAVDAVRMELEELRARVAALETMA